jgi:hypothetical protein
VEWGDMMAQGCKVKHFEDKYEFAWHVIGDLDKPTISAETAYPVKGLWGWVAQIKAVLSRRPNFT